jgi:NhaP-type Na+/H+ or K+/H+ antiporter
VTNILAYFVFAWGGGILIGSSVSRLGFALAQRARSAQERWLIAIAAALLTAATAMAWGAKWAEWLL